MGLCNGQLLQVRCSTPPVPLCAPASTRSKIHNAMQSHLSIATPHIRAARCMYPAWHEMFMMNVLCATVWLALWTPSARRWQSLRRTCALPRRSSPGSRLVSDGLIQGSRQPPCGITGLLVVQFHICLCSLAFFIHAADNTLD